MAGSPMHVMRGKVDEIATTRHDSLVTLHLGLECAARDHCSFAGRMPVRRRNAMGGKAGKDDGWSLAGITFLHCDGEAFRRVRYWTKLGTGSRIHDGIVRILSRDAGPCCTKQYCEDAQEHERAEARNHDSPFDGNRMGTQDRRTLLQHWPKINAP